MQKTRRILAWCIDFALVVAAASALAVLTFHRISGLFTDVPGLATRGGLDLLTSRGDVVDTSESVGLFLWNKALGYVEQGFLLLALATFLYQWGSLALAGRTLGKALTGFKVTPSSVGRTALRAAVTTIADVAVYALACVLLVEGEFLLSVLVWALAVVVFFLNTLPVLARSRRSLADRVAGTTVESLRLRGTVAVTPPYPPQPPYPAA
ncbi:RDD family protein [Streptomyces sp. NPDC052051]|uniref:RDD family protein n=1 Tax=Streptomyces sp. NPDC052051 TaxID=3154649 RepID=UPI00343C4513